MRFRPNPRLAQELARQPEMRRALADAARAVKTEAERVAPVGSTGRYARSFVVGATPEGATVGNTDFAAHWVEYGSRNNPPYAPLRRGVRAAGLRLGAE